MFEHSPAQPWDLLIRGGTVLDPAGVRVADVAVSDGRFAAVAPRLEGPALEVVEAAGLHVAPGAIDAHVHFGVPIAGERSADDHRTGTLAALCGGVTTTGDFTVQDPGEGLAASVARRIGEAGPEVFGDWFLHANVTSPSPAVLDEIDAVAAGGVASFKVFLAYPEMRVDLSMLEAILTRVARAGALLMVHAEDQALVEQATAKLVSEGRTSARWFFESRPAEAEARAVAEVGEVARRTGTPVYVVHLSSSAGLEAGRRARKSGAPLLLETCPQYLVLADGAVSEAPERLVCAPPLRSSPDFQALLAALATGEIDCLATDHCPFTNAQKAAGKDDFRRVPGGLPGVEHLLPFAYDLALAGRIPFERLASLVAATPARLFGLAQRKGRISAGLDADFVLLDPQAVTEISPDRMHSRTDWTPYNDFWLRGAVRSVYLRGRLSAASNSDGRVDPVAPPSGRYLAAKRSPCPGHIC